MSEELDDSPSEDDDNLSLYVSLSRPSSPKAESKFKNVVKFKIEKEKSPRVVRPSELQKIFGQRNQANSQYYVSQGSGIDASNQRDVSTEPSPFVLPKELEEFSYTVVAKAWHLKKRENDYKLKYTDRPTFRSRQSEKLLNRLYVEKPENNAIMVQDIDPEYFSIVEGRAIHDQFQMGKYMLDLRKCLQTKIQAGLRLDDIMRFDENYLEEQKAIRIINEQYEQYVEAFDNFLAQDHSESMKVLREAEKLATVTVCKEEERKELSKSLGQLKIKIYVLEELWRNAKVYQRFLYEISPLHWREQYDTSYKMRMQLMSGDNPAEVMQDYGAYRMTLKMERSLERLIEQYKLDISHEDEPILYFQEPGELIKVFRLMEIQNLNSLLHSEELAIPLESMKDTMFNAKKSFTAEIAAMQDLIEDLEKNILWEERHAEDLEHFANNLINGAFKQVINTTEALNMLACVEDTYERVISKNDSNLNMFEMMRAIEVKCESLLMTLDNIPLGVVKQAERSCRLEADHKMKIAKDAARKVELIDTLQYKLQRALEAPTYSTRKPMKQRSPPPARKPKPPPPPPELTVEEYERLTFFTDNTVVK